MKSMYGQSNAWKERRSLASTRFAATIYAADPLKELGRVTRGFAVLLVMFSSMLDIVQTPPEDWDIP
jgi:hypothetical protein